MILYLKLFLDNLLLHFQFLLLLSHFLIIQLLPPFYFEYILSSLLQVNIQRRSNICHYHIDFLCQQFSLNRFHQNHYQIVLHLRYIVQHMQYWNIFYFMLLLLFIHFFLVIIFIYQIQWSIFRFIKYSS